MGCISLVIADTDESYIEALSVYLMEEHSQRFEISCFTGREPLEKFISETAKRIQILLITPQLHKGIEYSHKVDTVILLHPGNPPCEEGELPGVCKYQNGGKLAAQIANIHFENTSEKFFMPDGGKQARVIAVYSPSGGAGNTSVSISLSICGVQTGLSVFYLNLEEISSIPSYFNSENPQNLSNIFYYLREKNKNMALKIEGARCIDVRYGVHYFLPPDSSMEFDEISAEELRELVSQLKRTGKYDAVVIDMPHGLNPSCRELMKLCDKLVFVTSHDNMSIAKFRTFNSQLDLLWDGSGSEIAKKSLLAVNKYNALIAQGNAIQGNDMPAVTVPLITGHNVMRAVMLTPGMDTQYMRTVRSLAERCFRQ
ncbi:AAA domain-containing protein [Anaerobacterium chartisolvens]|uniref:AAA domain-containing protein n=1 Tax=Anaerobacterium chartisolvens TaxID=1297424 RepID=A0A369AMV9_9FIRM|nr:AAA family ATPase [Anaerobacterium chartisolvens]RCX09606.1 AAA domain-containing protein [Anaerobacterium chartisolvens]